MIEPEHRPRLGVTINLPMDGTNDWTGSCRSQINGLGFQNVRLALSHATLDTNTNLAVSLDRISDALTILPSVPLDSEASVYELMCQVDRTKVRYVELTIPNGFGDAVDLARLASTITRWVSVGFKVVLGFMNAHIPTFEDLIARLPLEEVVAIGLGLQISEAQSTSCARYLSQALTAVARKAPGLKLWLTSLAVERRAWCETLAGEVLLEALRHDLERIYWETLVEEPGSPRLVGLYDVGGELTLMGRLLTNGVKELDRVTGLARKRPMPSIVGSRPILVTGGAGFIGANLTDSLASEGHNVVIFDALLRPGVEQNLHWLARRHPRRVSFVLGDLRDEDALAEATVQSEAVFHLAGQVAVTSSLVNPLLDFDINARGTLALLESIRVKNPDCPVVFASTNKVYGDLSDITVRDIDDAYLPDVTAIRQRGIAEDRPLCFHTPYGCSKGTADQYVLDYANSFGLKTAVLRMSCIYGERQLGTEDQGWVAHFLLRAMAGETLTIYGDGRQVRDILHVGDAVSAYLAAWRRIGSITGRPFNLGGGPQNAISLRHLISHIESLLGRRIDVRYAGWRAGDQRYFVADTTAIRDKLGLAPALGWREGVARLANYFRARSIDLTDTAEAAS